MGKNNVNKKSGKKLKRNPAKGVHSNDIQLKHTRYENSNNCDKEKRQK